MTTLAPASGTVIQHLTEKETRDFKELDGRVTEGLHAFFDTAKALKEIRDRELYKVKWRSFEDYAQDRFQLARNRAYQYLDAAEVMESLADHGFKPEQLPALESHAIALSPVPEEQRGLAWADVLEQAKRDPKTGKPKIKAKLVQICAETYAPPEVKERTQAVMFDEAEKCVRTLIRLTDDIDSDADDAVLVREAAGAVRAALVTWKRKIEGGG